MVRIFSLMRKELFALILLCFFSASQIQGAILPMDKSRAFFEKNEGQITNPEGVKADHVYFKAEAPGLVFWLMEDRIIFQTWKSEGDHQLFDLVEWLPQKGQIRKENIISQFQLPAPKRIFGKHASVLQPHLFERLLVKDVFPGIDWLFYFTGEGRFKHEFILAPGVSAQSVKLLIRSAQKPSIEKKGQLVIPSRFGDLVEEKPVSFHGHDTLATDFEIFSIHQTSENYFETLLGYSFDEMLLNISDTLIIDPMLSWGSFFGGNGSEVPMSMDTDPAGNLYVVGYTSSTDFPLLNPGSPAFFQGSFLSGLFDAFILKFSANGVLLWSSYFGTASVDYFYSVVCDASANVFIGGSTQSASFPLLNPSGGAFFQASSNGATEGVILKINQQGELVWSTYAGGNQWDEVVGIELDPFGNLLATGYSQSLNFPLSAPFQASRSGLSDAFAMKFTNSGSLLWSTYYGGSNNDRGNAICSDQAGNVYLTGYAASNNLSISNGFQSTYGGGFEDAFVVCFSSSGNLVWSTYLGGSNRDEGNSIRCDFSGAVYIQGRTLSTNFPIQNAFQSSFGGTEDAFLTKFSPSGALLWSTYLGGNGIENNIPSFDNLEVDSCNRVYVSFETTSSNITRISLPCSYNDNSLGGTRDQFLMRFSSTGTPDWATYAGGSANDSRSPLALDGNGALYLAGDMFGGPYNPASYPLLSPVGGAYFDNSFNGGTGDFFISKFKPAPGQTNLTVVPASDCSCIGQATLTVTNCGNPPFSFIWSNGFTQNSPSLNNSSISGLCPGNYFVLVRGLCYVADSIPFTVSSGAGILPDAQIASPPVLPCSGSPVTLNASSSTPGVLYSWTGPGIVTGGNSSQPDVNRPGLYTLTVTNPLNGCSQSFSVTLTLETVVPAFNIQTDICQGSTTFTLPTVSTNGISGIWSPPDLQTTVTGLFNYTFTPLTGQCAQSVQFQNRVLPPPTASPIIEFFR